jgi:AcrR family transcriptional regulator
LEVLPVSTVPSAPSRTSPARDRLLAVADELFYAEGITTTGIDRLIAEAQVTKATFYKHYGSKDALILEYVAGRDRQVREALEGLREAHRDPAAVLTAVVDAVVADTARLDFRGDPFLNAAAEFAAPTHPVRLAVTEHRDWFTGFLEDRFRELGHARPGAAADEFALLRDGAVCGSYAGDAVAASTAFVRAAHRLLRTPAAD